MFRPEDYDTLTDTSTLFWGALIFVALVTLCFLAWKAIERLRNRRKTPEEHGHQAISRPPANGYGSDLGSFASMIVSGREESSSDRSSRKARKAAKARRRAHD